MKEVITPRYEEQIIETFEVNKIIGMYAAEPIYKTWTEDFLDKDTGEIVSIERNEKYYNAGTCITVGKACEIDFHIQCGDITKPIKATNVQRTSEANKFKSYRPMMVHVSTGIAKPWMLLWADSFVHAIEVACDYFEQILTDNFNVIEVKYLGATLVDNKESYEKQKEHSSKVDISLNPLRYYTVDVIWKEAGTPYPFINPSKEAKDNLRYGTYVCMADSLDEVKEIVGPEVSKEAMRLDGWKSIEVHWDKGKPMAASIIVPKDFCDAYYDHFKSIEDGKV